jgi:hypothetical protein
MPNGPDDGAQFVDAATAGKPELIVHIGDLPATARALRDLFARSGYLFDRDMPVKVVQPGGDGPMLAIALTYNSVVVEAHRLCQPVSLATRSGRVTGFRLSSRSMPCSTIALLRGHTPRHRERCRRPRAAGPC